MKFNFARKTDFPPELTVSGFNDQLETVNQTKLLGVILTDDLKWSANTEFICKKASQRMWKLRRLRMLCIEPLVILDVYLKEIRSVLELAVPQWANC